MTRDEHRQRHIELHHALDELIADWIRHSPPDPALRLPSKHSIMELVRWSYEQTVDPIDLPVDPPPAGNGTGLTEA